MFDFVYVIPSVDVFDNIIDFVDNKKYDDDFKLKLTDDLCISREDNELCVELTFITSVFHNHAYGFKYKTEWTSETKKFIMDKLKDACDFFESME